MTPNSKYIQSRIIDRFSDGGRYFAGIYDPKALAYIEETRAKFPFSHYVNYTFYKPRTLQRYLIVKEKFQDSISGTILDVGSRDDTAEKVLERKCQLVDKNNPNLPEWDWEKELLPYGDKSFDTVICLDTLEHINDIHRSFADLTRVAKQNLIISLPNCWKKTTKKFVRGFGSGASYGLPPEKPMDRHKWFFATEDIDNFIFYNVYKNGFDVVNISYHMPKTTWWHRIVFPLAKLLLPEHYSKNLFVETVLIAMKRR